jgi:PAS domain S-box-containing protein
VARQSPQRRMGQPGSRALPSFRASEAGIVRGLLGTTAWAFIGAAADGRILFANDGACRLFGYRHRELIGRPLDDVLSRGSAASRSVRSGRARRADAAGAVSTQEGRRRDGTLFPVQVELRRVQRGRRVVSVAWVLDLTGRESLGAALAQRDRELADSRCELQSLTASLLTAQERERERIALELHDDLNQRLAALAMQISVLERPPLETRDVVRLARSLRASVETLSGDMRRIARHLHPALLEHFGLETALSSLCDEVASTGRLAAHFRAQNVPDCLPQGLALNLYRIVQEAVANILRHARAGSVTVTLAGRAAGLHLVIADDGVGFDPGMASGGMGLTGMRERVRLVGGTISIGARPGQGTRIEVSVKLSGV